MVSDKVRREALKDSFRYPRCESLGIRADIPRAEASRKRTLDVDVVALAMPALVYQALVDLLARNLRVAV